MVEPAAKAASLAWAIASAKAYSMPHIVGRWQTRNLSWHRTDSGDIVLGGGIGFVLSGGMAIGLTVSKARRQCASSNGVTSGPTIADDTLEIAARCLAESVAISFEASGGIPIVGGAKIPSNTVCGLAPSEAIDVKRRRLVGR